MTSPAVRIGASLVLAAQALRAWTTRQVLVAVAAGLAVALLVGFVTVLIPNAVFARDIPPVWWNYPVWLVTSALSGMLAATYVRAGTSVGPADETAVTRPETTPDSHGEDSAERRTSRLGIAGGILAWFAVGCPVCNKIALLALGYSGAITWFAPVQPFLAAGALALTAVALVWRLRGQVSCPVRPPPVAVAR